MVQFLNPGMAMVDCLVDIETIIFLEHINLASRVKLANLFLGRLNNYYVAKQGSCRTEVSLSDRNNAFDDTLLPGEKSLINLNACISSLWHEVMFR